MEDPNNDSIPWKEQEEVSAMGYFFVFPMKKYVIR